PLVLGCGLAATGLVGSTVGLVATKDAWRDAWRACRCEKVEGKCSDSRDCCEGLGCGARSGAPQTTCAPAFDCTGRKDGSYCGPGQTSDLLYTCKNGEASVSQACSAGCGPRASGLPEGNDDCLPPPDCYQDPDVSKRLPKPDGVYCGGSI